MWKKKCNDDQLREFIFYSMKNGKVCVGKYFKTIYESFLYILRDFSPGIKSQTILTISYVKGSKVSLRKSRGDVFTRFCIDFAGKQTSFESLWGNV